MRSGATEGKRLRVTWWAFSFGALFVMGACVGVSALYSQAPWPNDTTAVLVIAGASAVGYTALGWRRLRAEVRSRDPISQPTPDEIKTILLGPRFQRWAWIIVTFAVAVGVGLYLSGVVG